MVEALITIVGIIITFIPVIFFVNYLFKRVKRKTRFDYHLELVRDKKGKIGVFCAYCERILLSVLIMVLGIHMSEFFQIEALTIILVSLIVLYAIFKYFDINNET